MRPLSLRDWIRSDLVLACISHHMTAEAHDTTARTSLFLRNAFLPCSTYGSSTPASAKRLAPFSSARLAPSPDGPLTHFASPRGEICRLEGKLETNMLAKRAVVTTPSTKHLPAIDNATQNPSLPFSPPDGRSTRYDRHDFIALACRAQRTVQVRLRAPFSSAGLRLVLTALSPTSPRHVVRNAG